jgi:hypothetical protein
MFTTLNELLAIDSTNESLKTAVGAAILGAAAMVPSTMVDHLPPKPSAESVAKWNAHVAKKEAAGVTKALKHKYSNISNDELTKIFALAKKHEHADFPKAADILAIVGIESSFKKTATSNLEKDPAYGLMQVRPEVWGTSVKNLATVESQIKFGSDILHKYYQKLGDPDDAVHAYNIGITNFKRGTGLNPSYVEKFHKERNWLAAVWKKIFA